MAGIYIHIPFCKQACSYCDFHFSTTFSSYREELIDTLCHELILRKSELHFAPLNSIYFGGGTPSLLTAEELFKILNTIDENFEKNNDCEITLECNPDDINEEKLEQWKNYGINRLSIGVQSFLDQDLKWMNRAHNSTQAENALELVSKSTIPMTLDLIYGLPNTSKEMWIENIKKAILYAPEHISAYCLTIEPKTKLFHQIQKGEIIPCGEDEQANQFDILVNLLNQKGYEQYEISNFAKNNSYAVHNTSYWTGKAYIGIGPSAHSFNGKNERRWNINNNLKYIKSIKENETYFETEKLEPKDRFNELILTGLRTKWGVNLSDLQIHITLSPSFEKTKQQYLSSNHIIENNNFLVLTEKGKLIADRIASDFFE